MKVGVVSNFYPPYVYGGYEIGCAQVVDGLRDRGIDLQVATSTKVPRNGRSHVHNVFHSSFDAVFAKMHPLSKLAYIIRHEAVNLFEFRRFLRKTRPNVVYFWNVTSLSRSLITEAKKRGLRVGLFAFDHGLTDLSSDAWLAQFQKIPGKSSREVQRIVMSCAGFLMGRPDTKTLCFDFVHYPTRYLRNVLQRGGITAASWSHIPWGVDTETFYPADRLPTGKLLYVGQVSEHKGVHVALEALGLLAQSAPDLEWSLTIAGQCLDPKYQAKLDELIARHDLGRRVRFTGFVAREDLPAVYREHSILLFPSIWEEPMGISVLEAMASGLCMISSGTGGSRELYRDGVTGLTCQPDNAEDWCRALREVLLSSELARALGHEARTECALRAQLAGTIASVEKHLTGLELSRKASGRS